MSSQVAVQNLNKNSIDEMMEKSEERKQEIINFLKCIQGNPERLFSLCKWNITCASSLDSESFEIVPLETIVEICDNTIKLLTSGLMKVDGKVNNFSNGCFGSRWFDLDAEKYDCDFIRFSFYSKKYSKDWKFDKPYAIHGMIEKCKE